MSTEGSVLALEDNPKVVYEEASRILIKIADNILNNPSNLKIRALQKNNSVIKQKLLAAKGGLECLLGMGFRENGATFILPTDVPLTKLKLVRDAIEKRKQCEKLKTSLCSLALPEGNANKLTDSVGANLEKPISRIVLPPLTAMFQNPFLHQIEIRFHEVLVYENTDLQNRAKKLIPVHELEIKAQENLRKVQEQIKKGKASDVEISIQDMLILELLAWFKSIFFEWVDSPRCEHCGGTTTMSHMSTDPELLLYTNRVEMHICSVCKKYTPFPRYNDLNILLETRKGRCGEWANVFTLLCRSMGWDARYVVDQTDHVWTEVYSLAQKSWLHCDPCENSCDTPLIYESGWGKKLSYIIAYSGEEVQDVTWRYSSHHKEVLARRNECSELDLVAALVKLREERQKNLSKARKHYLVKRLLMELVELMQEKKPKDEEQQGRISGSLTWRLARGETEDCIQPADFTWVLPENISVDKSVTVRYSTATDQYEFCYDGKKTSMKVGWSSGVLECEGVFRKEEKDWKMTYLARKEDCEIGRIKWKFQIDDAKKAMGLIKIRLDRSLYENGNVQVYLTDYRNVLQMSESIFETEAFSGSRSLEIEVILSGGRGNVAWQHAQIFRQKADSEDFPFSIDFKFIPV